LKIKSGYDKIVPYTKREEQMNLRDYLHFKRLSAVEFSKKVGVSANYIRMLANGQAKAGVSLAKIIEIETNGEVKPNEIN
jgi:hypothetical protein